jgi:Ca-activated chloride channel homolog
MSNQKFTFGIIRKPLSFLRTVFIVLCVVITSIVAQSCGVSKEADPVPQPKPKPAPQEIKTEDETETQGLPNEMPVTKDVPPSVAPRQPKSISKKSTPGDAAPAESGVMDMESLSSSGTGYGGGGVGRGMSSSSTTGRYMPNEKRRMPPVRRPFPDQEFNTENYNHIQENEFLGATENPLSTFSIDVDKASYANVRRFIDYGQMPQKDAVRIEELVNYFHYDYPQPKDEHPFSITTELSACPWNSEHKLVQVGLQGKTIATKNLPPSNLVFLIDVSGSMESENKLPLVKSAIKLLVNKLRAEDRVSMVVYAGAAGVVLHATSGSNKEKILCALDQLQAGGSTAGAEGIELAYKIAAENFCDKGNNRIVLCTDGDFNVGVSSDAELVRLIERKREKGIFLSVAGFGMGNYKDSKMEQIADKGNGNYAYIDSEHEAKKVFVSEFGGTLFTIAKDVKIQVEFNPSRVKSYRLIGYENRMLKKEDFNNDKKDAGEIGSGHSVTALYEIVPIGANTDEKSVDPLKYQARIESPKAECYDLFTVKFRYKKPDGEKSILLERIVRDEPVSLSKTSDNFRFAAAVAGYGMLLRDSEFKGSISYADVLEQATKARGDDHEGYRDGFVKLVRKTMSLRKPIAGKD